MKRLFFAASIALTTVFVASQTTAYAVLPGTHTSSSPALRPSAVASLSEMIAQRARKQASAMCSVGFCYRGVKRALNSLGIGLTGTAAWMARTQLANDKRFCMVPLKSLKKGDILVHGRSAAHPYGHIAVYLGNDEEASDHVQKLVLGGRYGDTVVFRARSDRDAALAARQIAQQPPEKLPVSKQATAAKTVIAHAMHPVHVGHYATAQHHSHSVPVEIAYTHHQVHHNHVSLIAHTSRRNHAAMIAQASHHGHIAIAHGTVDRRYGSLAFARALHDRGRRSMRSWLASE